MKPVTLALAFYCCTLSVASFSQAVVATEITESSNVSTVVHVNANCLKHFSRSFLNAPAPRWSESDNGFGAHFTNNGMKYDVRYNRRGHWQCTIRYVPVEQLKRNIVRIVHNEYRHYNIFFAQQVSVPTGSVYFVKIEKGNEWKLLRIVNSSVEVIGDYVKG